MPPPPFHIYTRKTQQYQRHVNAPRALVSGARLRGGGLVASLSVIGFFSPFSQASVKQRGNEGERTAERAEDRTAIYRQTPTAPGFSVDGGSTGNAAAGARDARGKWIKCLAKVCFFFRACVYMCVCVGRDEPGCPRVLPDCNEFLLDSAKRFRATINCTPVSQSGNLTPFVLMLTNLVISGFWGKLYSGCGDESLF